MNTPITRPLIPPPLSIETTGLGSRTVQDVLDHTHRNVLPTLSAPSYFNSQAQGKVFFAVENMSRHTADAGWQLTLGLQHAGYALAGYDLEINNSDVRDVIRKLRPGIAVLQDKREWDGRTANQRKNPDLPLIRFKRYTYLQEWDDLLKLTVLKDCQQRPKYHQKSAEEIGCHAWIVYYHPRIVKHLATYVRPEHLIRTVHSLEPSVVPDYQDRPDRVLLSGAISSAYPLRRLLLNSLSVLPNVKYQRHPGYHSRGCVTPDYLKLLSGFRVAICTSSRFGFSLRKHIEATAAGCIVITDLPTDDRMPFIDNNLVRVGAGVSDLAIRRLIKELYSKYDPERQEQFSLLAQTYYDWRNVGERLSSKIDHLRSIYNQTIED